MSYVNSYWKCADIKCKVPISIATALQDQEPPSAEYISFKKGETLTIFGKDDSSDNPLWQGSLEGEENGKQEQEIGREQIENDDHTDRVDNFGSESHSADEARRANEGNDKDTNEDHSDNEDDNNKEHEAKLVNENDRTTFESFAKDSGQNPKNDGSQDEINDKNNQNKRTGVYTDPNGVQYDVAVEYSSQDSKDEIQIVDVKEQDLSGNDKKPEMSDDKDREPTEEKKEGGFFSKMGNIVSDFTENIIKDFQGDEEQNGKFKNSDHEPVKVDKTTNGESSDKTGRKVEDDDNIKTDSFQTSSIPPVDEEEILKVEAKKTVEEIPGLMKQSELSGNDVTNKRDLFSLESDHTVKKQYTDKQLCSSVAVKDREVCLKDGTKEDCLQDNCCWDESAAASQQCFFKPSTPEPGFVLEEEPEKNNNAATDNLDTGSKESSWQPEKTAADVPSETKEQSDPDKGNKVEVVDEDENESSTEEKETAKKETVKKDTESIEKDSDEDDFEREVEHVEVKHTSHDLDESLQKDFSKNDFRATGKGAEETLREPKKPKEDKQEDVDNPVGYEDIIEEKTNDDSEIEDEDGQTAGKDKTNVDGETTSDVSEDDPVSKEKVGSDAGSSTTDANVEKQEPEKESAIEEDDLHNTARDERSARDSGVGVTQDSLANEDVKDQEVRSRPKGETQENEVSPGLEDDVQEKGEAILSSEESVEKKDPVQNSADKDVKQDASEPDDVLSSQEIPSAAQGAQESASYERASNESKDGVQDWSKTEAENRKEDHKESPGFEDLAEENLVKDVADEGERDENKTAEKEPDVAGIMDKIKTFLPFGGTKEEAKSESLDDVAVPKKENIFEKEGDVDVQGVLDTIKTLNGEHENRKFSNDRARNEVNVDKVKIPMDDNGETDGEDKEQKGVKDDVAAENDENTNGIEENVDEVKSDAIQSEEKTNEKKTTNVFDNSDTSSEVQDILAEILEEESVDTKDTSNSIVPDTTETTVEITTGSTQYRNNTEQTLHVEKTLDTTEGTSQGSKEAGVQPEETKIERKSIEPDVLPSKTRPVVASDTVRRFEKKFPHIASKWVKNKLMKGKQALEEDVQTTDGKEEQEKVDSEPQTGTCAKDRSCQKTATFSSVTQRSILRHDDDDVDLDDNDIVEPSPLDRLNEEESDVNKASFKKILAGAVRKFRKYHNIVAGYGMQVLRPIKNIVKPLGEQMGLGESIRYLEQEISQGPQGVIAVPLIMIAFVAYFVLSILCGKSEPPCYGPNLKDIFRTYEGRIRILEEDCADYEERITNMKNKADQDTENSTFLEKQLDDEKHERNKSEEQISILKEIVKNLNEKVDLLAEESSKLKQSLDEKSKRISETEEQLSVKSKEMEKTEERIKELEEELKVKNEEKSVLNENIDEYKQQLSKAEDDADRHKTMLQDWNDRYHELQQKYDDVSVSKQTMEEQLHFKDNEIEVLRDTLVQINSNVHINSDEELSPEEMQEAKSEKIKELMDVSQIRTDYKLCKEEKEKLEDDMKQQIDRRERLEGEVEQLETDLAKSKASEEEIRFKYREADIKLNALQDYFKNMESDLHRKLTAEEAARIASESELERKLREASTAVQDVELYRKQVEELRKEIDETQQAFRSQISSTEERAHENWIKFRTAERELEEIKRERDALRRRLYDLEASAQARGAEDPISPIVAENLESTRSESPAASIRSSKRKNSNPRKSPSGSPLEDRKERSRRKPRDRYSPPTWDGDMDPPPRRRDKERDTTPPPPPLFDPSMRRKRDSPNMDGDRRRRERYTPSPPPPPPDSMISPSGRRRRDRDGSSSPPPPPPCAFRPRGPGLPMVRTLPPNIPRVPPPYTNSTRPNMMPPQPNGVNGMSPLGNIRPSSNSTLRAPYEQSLRYSNSTLENNTADEDQPPPPPVFANSGPYSRTPPWKKQSYP